MKHAQGVPLCTCGGTVSGNRRYEESLDEKTLTKASCAIGLRQTCLLMVGGTSLTVYPAAVLHPVLPRQTAWSSSTGMKRTMTATPTRFSTGAWGRVHFRSCKDELCSLDRKELASLVSGLYGYSS